MEKYTEEKIVYPIVYGCKIPSRYGFAEVDGGLIFSKYNSRNYFDANNDSIWSKFFNNNFRKLADISWMAMKYDAERDRSRKRKLSTFIKSIFDQEDINAALVMLSAIHYYRDDMDEQDLVSYVIKKIMPGAGFHTEFIDGKYMWRFGKLSKSDKSIGKVFLIYYINSGFDKDKAWQDIKKNCYLKNGNWCYKNSVTKQKIDKILQEYVRLGGIMYENMNHEFEAFIPMSVMNKDASGSGCFVSKDTNNDGKNLYIYGTASDTSVDFDEERVTDNFIKSMKKQAIGLPLKIGSHFSNDAIDSTVGVVTEKGGDNNTFQIAGKLQPVEDNELVGKLIKKMDFGIKYGFSIFGRITKAYREYNKELDKEIFALDDGVLSHILVTDQPANKQTFAEAIVKSIHKKPLSKDSDRRLPISSIHKHTSCLLKNEIEEDKIDKSFLPDQSFPIDYSNHNVHKDYPHHYVNEGNLYLHKDMLLSSFIKAKENGAPSVVVNHLMTHLQTIGLHKKLTDMEKLVKDIDSLSDVNEKMTALKSEMKDFISSIKMVKNLDIDKVDKKNKVTSMIKEVAPKLTNIINSIMESGEENAETET